MRKICVWLLLSTAFVSCRHTAQTPVSTAEGFALGTIYQISVKGVAIDSLQPRLDSLFEAVNASMSIFDPESLLSRLNDNRTDTLDSHIKYCIELAQRVSRLSDGKYDITVKPLADAYGFNNHQQIENIDVDSLLQLVGYEKISIEGNRLRKLSPLMQIDLNSIAKGYTVDMVAALLERLGAREYLVNIGGEILCRGTNAQGKEWVVGIERPYEGNFISGESIYTRIRLTNLALATSGNYRNFHTDSSGRKFTHIIDPVTGSNTRSSLLSASVIAPTCALADAYGTMFIALGENASRRFVEQHPDLPVLLIHASDDGSMHTFTSSAMKRHLLD